MACCRARSLMHYMGCGICSNKTENNSGAEGLPVPNKEFQDGFVAYWPVRFLAPLAVLYLFSRLYILVEALASLRALPRGSFQNVHWTTFIPHL